MIVIFEGPDRIGKDTQIQKFIENFSIKQNLNSFKIWHKLHYSKPPGNTKEEQELYSREMYSQFLRFIKNNIMNPLYESLNLVVNRSHIGESVYANLYRGYSGSYVFDLENDIIGTIPPEQIIDNLFLVTLVPRPGHVDMLIARNDDESFYSDLETATTEVIQFIDSHNKTSIPTENKILVEVSKGESIQDISDKIKKFFNDRI